MVSNTEKELLNALKENIIQEQVKKGFYQKKLIEQFVEELALSIDTKRHYCSLFGNNIVREYHEIIKIEDIDIRDTYDCKIVNNVIDNKNYSFLIGYGNYKNEHTFTILGCLCTENENKVTVGLTKLSLDELKYIIELMRFINDSILSESDDIFLKFLNIYNSVLENKENNRKFKIVFTEAEQKKMRKAREGVWEY